MEYKIIKPKGYRKPTLPMGKEWVAWLLENPKKQGRNTLCANGKYCCLGGLSKIQGRLKKIRTKGITEYFDGSDRVVGDSLALSEDNPLYKKLGSCGVFPNGVYVKSYLTRYESLASCNDNGFTFLEIADIIQQIWSVK